LASCGTYETSVAEPPAAVFFSHALPLNLYALTLTLIADAILTQRVRRLAYWACGGAWKILRVFPVAQANDLLDRRCEAAAATADVGPRFCARLGLLPSVGWPV